MLQADFGTENTITAAIHIAFHNDNLGQKSFIYGPSNQHCKLSFFFLLKKLTFYLLRELNLGGPNYVALKLLGGFPSVR